MSSGSSEDILYQYYLDLLFLGLLHRVNHFSLPHSTDRSSTCCIV
uniref:Uncharacterized protein n=1 Tax=Siphoviridae sp. ctLnP14 TaxID=2827851 RepID=A0A8S5S8P6_9CAUD|nr:MAG TPA: hypothetical protein [Siphoviridae sp. ctLnP14]